MSLDIQILRSDQIVNGLMGRWQGDFDVSYCSDTAPYKRYRWTGTRLVSVDADTATKVSRIGTAGDSIALLNTTAASYSYPAAGPLNWCQARLGQPWYYPVANQFAVFGSTLDQIIANQLPAILASHALKPISRLFISAGTNDTGALRPMATIKNDFKTLYGTLLNAGITPVHTGVLPRGNDGSLSAAKKANLQVNEWHQWYMYTIGGLEFIDSGAALANTANAFGNAVTSLVDGSFLHPLDNGSFHLGKIWADFYAARGIAPAFRSANQASDIYDATDNPQGVVFDSLNPFLTGGGSGVAPTGLTISPATAAWQWGSTRALPNGQTRPIGTLTLGATAGHFLYSDAVATGAFDTERIRTGDYVYAQSEIVLTGTTGLTVLNQQLVENDGSTAVDSRFLFDGSGGIPNITGPLTLYLRTAPVPIRAFSGSGNASVFSKLNLATSAGGGSVQVNSFELRKWVGEV